MQRGIQLAQGSCLSFTLFEKTTHVLAHPSFMVFFRSVTGTELREHRGDESKMAELSLFWEKCATNLMMFDADRGGVA